MRKRWGSRYHNRLRTLMTGSSRFAIAHCHGGSDPWLAREEQGTAVRTRIPVPPMILLTAAQSRAIFALIVILLPLAVIAIGAGVWWSRR